MTSMNIQSLKTISNIPHNLNISFFNNRRFKNEYEPSVYHKTIRKGD